MSQYAYTVGNDGNVIEHVSFIGSGGFGEVHEVSIITRNTD